jgi:hypothetical protein
MLRSIGVSRDIHGEVIHTGGVGARIGEPMKAIAVVEMLSPVFSV